MPENSYLLDKESKPKRINPYLSARENPYLKATDIPILEQGVEPSLFQRGKEVVADFFRPSFAPEPTAPPGMEGMPESAIPAGMEMDIPGRRDAINTRLDQISAGATTDSIDSLQAQLEGITSRAVDGALPPDLYEQYTALRPQYEQAIDAYNAQATEAQELGGELEDLKQQEYGAEMMRPISTVTGEPVPTFEEEAAGGRAAMAIVPYGFASAVRGMVPPALERAVLDPLTQAVVGKEYVSPIDEALKIGKYLPEEAQAAIGIPTHMAGAIVPLSVSFKTAGAIMKAVGLPPDLVLRTGPVMDRIVGHVARGGIAGAVYGGLEGGTPQDMAEDAAFFGALEGGLGAVGGIFRKIFSANWYRSLEVKERGLVVQSLDDMLDRGYSEREILKKWNNPMWREEALARRAVGEPPPEPAASDLSETQRDLVKGVIREEMAKRPAPVPAIPEEPFPTVSPMEIVPGIPPEAPAPMAGFPPGQGFEFIEPMPETKLRLGSERIIGPEDAEYIAGRPMPEELEVEYKPILGSSGLPWKEKKNALKAFESKRLKKLGITEETHEVVPVKNGFGVAKKAEEIIEPEIVPEVEKELIAEIPPEIPTELEKMSLPELLSAHEKGSAFNLENKEPEASWGEPCKAKFEELTGEKWSPETVRKTKEEVVPKAEIPEKPAGEVPLAEPEILPEMPKKLKAEEKIPAEPVKPEAIEIPEFKHTEDALAFGKTATPEQIESMKTKRDEILAKIEEKKARGETSDMAELMRSSYLREAIQSSEGKIVEPEFKPKEPVVEAPAKEPWEMGKEDLRKQFVKESVVEGVTYKTEAFAEYHKRQVENALKSGKLTPEKYSELHVKDYGLLEKFMPEITEIVKRAIKNNVVDIDQLSPFEIKALNYAVGMGILEKARGGSYPVLHTVYAKPGYDFKGEREKALEKLKKPVPKPEKEPLSETKSRLLENIKSEKGSSELINDLSRLGADAMRRGHTTYKAFSAEMKTELSSVWEKIKSLIRKAYFAAKKILKSERGAVEIGKPKVERKRPWLTKSQKERRAKKKAIKEKQLKIENAKEAKEQIHSMIRDRRQNLNLSAYETNLFVNDIEQQTTKVQREVIPFIIEKTDIPKSLNRPDLEKTYKKDKDNLSPIALQVKQHFDAGWLKMKENIPDMSAEQIENYVTHIWDLNKGQKRIVTNWFTTQNRFLKKRYIETLREGIEELGLTPKVLDISEIIRIHDGVANRAIENTKFVEGLKELKHEGVPLIARADLAPQNWVYFDHPALRRGLVIPGKLKMGEKVSPELSNLLAEMGVAIGRRISPVAFGKPVGKKGEYISGEPPEVRFQRFMSSRTVAHEIGHHLDEVLGLGYKFLNNYASELYAINRERIESRIGEKGKYGEAYVRSTEEQIAEFFATLFTDAPKAYRIAPNATADALNRLRQDEVLSKLIDFDFEKQAKNLIEEQLNTLVKLPVKVHPDLEKSLKIVFESRIDHPVIQAYEVMNGVLKKTNLSLSLFHHGALGETGIAIMGPRRVLNIYFNPVKIYKAMAQGKFDVFEKEPMARRWIGSGLQVGATADVPVNMIQSKLNNLARKTKNVPLINKTTEFVRTFNEIWDKALWNYLHDTLKLYACESLGTKIDPTKDMTKQEQEITQFVNDTFGGQNWDTLMVSPKSLQIMTWSLLSADWTTSTVRQALSPTGIGRAHKETIGMRRKLGAYFWIKAGLYFGAGINMLNYTFREWDEKENPKYYEGMGKRTFLDKTMAGNTMGHKTHLFVGRYEDGTERYIRWGKQFRELPELFFDDTGFSPISATFKKVGGKLAPMIQLTSKITTGTSPSGFRDDDIYGKKGWDRVYGMGKVLIKSPLPFATRALFQEDKKFHLTDLAMPSSKGMTRWKSINLFKHAIIKRDDQLLKETYQFTLMNNLPAYTLFSTALTILKAESSKEFNEGIKTIEDVKKMLDKVDNPKDLIRLGNKLKRIEKESVDRKLGMDLLDQAIRDIKKYELIEKRQEK